MNQSAPKARFERAEFAEMVQRWLAVNRRCEEQGDWTALAELYAEDATYGWNLGPNEEFMAVGRDQIREVAVGLEMAGLEGWQYPYERMIIDEVAGEVVGFWRQVAGVTGPDGFHYEVAGIAGSWFKCAGGLPVGMAARLIRPGKCHCLVRRDDRCWSPLGSDALTHTASDLQGAAARSLPHGGRSCSHVATALS